MHNLSSIQSESIYFVCCVYCTIFCPSALIARCPVLWCRIKYTSLDHEYPLSILKGFAINWRVSEKSYPLWSFLSQQPNLPTPGISRISERFACSSNYIGSYACLKFYLNRGLVCVTRSPPFSCYQCVNGLLSRTIGWFLIVFLNYAPQHRSMLSDC